LHRSGLAAAKDYLNLFENYFSGSDCDPSSDLSPSGTVGTGLPSPFSKRTLRMVFFHCALIRDSQLRVKRPVALPKAPHSSLALVKDLGVLCGTVLTICDSLVCGVAWVVPLFTP
jgi:hypothetical protein